VNVELGRSHQTHTAPVAFMQAVLLEEAVAAWLFAKPGREGAEALSAVSAVGLHP
jgi:hypothetical protein